MQSVGKGTKRSSRGVLLLILFLTYVTQSIAQQGPLEIENQYPYALAYVGSVPQSAKTLNPGEQRYRFSTDWSNTSTYRDHYSTDSEVRFFALSYQRGIAEDLDVALTVPAVWQGGGILDVPINIWHSTWGFPQGERRRVDDNRYRVRGDVDGSPFEVEPRHLHLSKLRPGARYQFWHNSTDAFAVSLRLGLPTAPSNATLSGIDTVSSLLHTHCWKSSCLHSGLSQLFRQDTSLNGLSFNRTNSEAFSQWELRLSPNASFLVGLYGGSGSLRSVTGHPDFFVYLDTGARLAVSSTIAIDAAFRENPIPSSGTTDFTFHVSVAKSLY